MQLENTFLVPAPPEKAWPLLLDVERIAPCLPGAILTEMIDPRSFKGRATVKVGPVSLTFEGSAKLVDVDDADRTARLEARGSDAKGRGGGHAEVRFELVPEGYGTRVTVNTHLVMNGAVAQYGRASGLMQEVANQLVTQFATNLAAQLDHVASGTAAVAPVNSISGLGLIGVSLRAIIARWVQRLTMPRS